MSEKYNNNAPDEFFESIKVISVCPSCGAKYNITQAKILEERENGHLLHIQCKKCKSSVVSLILSNNYGVSSVSLVTDLSSEDVLKFKDREPVTPDDILDVHMFLLDKKFDLSQL